MGKLAALVKKAKRGDGEAFVSLVQQYEDVLYKVASRLLHNDEDVADAMQEAIVVAYEKIHTLKNEAYFNTWICKILINTCNGILNKRQKIRLVDQHVEQKQNKNEFLKIELEDALNSLNKEYKIAIVLYYIVGLSIKEISEFLKEPEGTIKSRLSRAKSILRNHYYSGEGVSVNEQ
ncbi:sigma-70 family RNA polymerase sigma factor [Microbacteriaceae bacterium 4G12]